MRVALLVTLLVVLAVSVTAVKLEVWQAATCDGSPYASTSVPDNQCQASSSGNGGSKYACSGSDVVVSSYDKSDCSGTASDGKIASGQCITAFGLSVKMTCGATATASVSALLMVALAFIANKAF